MHWIDMGADRIRQSLLIAGLAAGLSVVTEPSIAQLPQAKRITTIGGTSFPLSFVTAVSVSDSLVFVVQPQDQTILVFRYDGAFVRRIGRKGSGPGEFRDIGRIGQKGDSLWTYDRSLRRTSIFSPSGALGRTFLVEVRPRRDLGLPIVLGVSDNSDLLVSTALRHEGVTYPRELPLIAVDTAGHERPLGMVAAPPVHIVLPGGATMMTIARYEQLFNGLLVAATGNSVFVSSYDQTGKPFQVTQTNYAGSAAVMTYTRPRYEVPEELLEGFRKEAVPDVQKLAPSLTDPLQFLRDNFPTPKFFPPARAIFADENGVVWVEAVEARGTTCSWTRLDRTNPQPIARTPASFRGLAFRSGRAWGVETDADGDFTVASYGVLGAK